MGPRYRSLADFLIATPLHANGYIDDGTWGRVPVKGCQIEAVVLFVDFASFTKRTAELDPVETLICVQLFLSWMTGSGLAGRAGVIDKYMGDQLMVIFSKELGSEDPLVDAVRTAADMIAMDAMAFEPHIGLALGSVLVAHTGTTQHFECSVFGSTVSLASRCVGLPPPEGHPYAITLPAEAWDGRDLREVLPPEVELGPGADMREAPYRWVLSDPQEHELKGFGKRILRQIWSKSFRIPPWDVVDEARRLRREMEAARQPE